MWYVYILKCGDGTLYTGISKDPARRVQEHNLSTIGARYTRSRLPVELVYVEPSSTRSEAQKREALIKKMRRHEKETMISHDPLKIA
ncbi:MAG: GIY-YIG nuclease family protein [Candidatus Omnitrophica bacterium]|nr:GIY-YIG nuclease family protein [Candidatus Omnitrophota bacterium]MDD5488072.1 GIY-YIG nuclease family protein [Candidatus Omnitrophota bacterium]